MQEEILFSAPWSLAVTIVTLVVLALLLGGSLIGLTAIRPTCRRERES